jgi:hypothetical protein
MKDEDSGMIRSEMSGWRSAVISNSMSMGADPVAGCRQIERLPGRERKSPREIQN